MRYHDSLLQLQEKRMALARKHQIDLSMTQYYHCISRCVRQAYLCGKSQEKNYSHRREWLLLRLKHLCEIFSINVCAYAVMSNHYHLVLHVDVKSAKRWSDKEVITRWRRLFKTAPDIGNLHIDVGTKLVEQWRSQLMDVSWFMRCLNEYLARRANIEEGCKGRFWEGRFKSQALLGESALLTCMSYVDLNPVRAGMCKSLEESDFTSIQQRLRSYTNKNAGNKHKVKLMDFCKQADSKTSNSIPFDEKSYIDLVYWTGRAVRENKRGFIPMPIKTTLNMYEINEKQWVQSIQHFGSRYSWLIGRIEEIKARCIVLNKKWIRGIGTSNSCFLSKAV